MSFCTRALIVHRPGMVALPAQDLRVTPQKTAPVTISCIRVVGSESWDIYITIGQVRAHIVLFVLSSHARSNCLYARNAVRRAQTGDGGFASVSHLVRKVCVSPRKNGCLYHLCPTNDNVGYVSSRSRHQMLFLKAPRHLTVTIVWAGFAFTVMTFPNRCRSCGSIAFCTRDFIVHRPGMVALPAYLTWCVITEVKASRITLTVFLFTSVFVAIVCTRRFLPRTKQQLAVSGDGACGARSACCFVQVSTCSSRESGSPGESLVVLSDSCVSVLVCIAEAVTAFR